MFRHPRLEARYSLITRNIAIYVPAAFFFAFFLGATVADKNMSQASASHRIEVATTTQGEGEAEVRLLRSFQDWILILDENGGLAWIHLDDVIRIQVLKENSMFKGVVCLFSASWCLSNAEAE